MAKRRKTTRRRTGLQVVTLCISTTMVLILLGMVVLSVLMARNLSAYVKENLTVTVMLNDNVSTNSAKLLCRDLYHRPIRATLTISARSRHRKSRPKPWALTRRNSSGSIPFPPRLR